MINLIIQFLESLIQYKCLQPHDFRTYETTAKNHHDELSYGNIKIGQVDFTLSLINTNLRKKFCFGHKRSLNMMANEALLNRSVIALFVYQSKVTHNWLLTSMTPLKLKQYINMISRFQFCMAYMYVCAITTTKQAQKFVATKVITRAVTNLEIWWLILILVWTIHLEHMHCEIRIPG